MALTNITNYIIQRAENAIPHFFFLIAIAYSAAFLLLRYDAKNPNTLILIAY